MYAHIVKLKQIHYIFSHHDYCQEFVFVRGLQSRRIHRATPTTAGSQLWQGMFSQLHAQDVQVVTWPSGSTSPTQDRIVPRPCLDPKLGPGGITRKKSEQRWTHLREGVAWKGVHMPAYAIWQTCMYFREESKSSSLVANAVPGSST